jgi:hypothetical protein
MSQYFVPSSVDADLFPLMEAAAKPFGIKIERVAGQVYTIHPQPLVDQATGQLWSFNPGLAYDRDADRRIGGTPYLPMAWFFKMPLNDPPLTLTYYAKQHLYSKTAAWLDPLPASIMKYQVGGYYDPSTAFVLFWRIMGRCGFKPPKPKEPVL